MKDHPSFEFIELLFTISRLMKGEMSYTNNLTHLSVLQIQTLIFLSQSGRATMSEIAQNFRIELPSATSLITKLCDQKLVKRYEDVNDRRLVRITLTGEGKTLMEQAIRGRKRKIEKILSYLSVKQRSELFAILETLHAKLKKIE